MVVDVIKSSPGGCPGWSKPIAWASADEENLNWLVVTDDKKTKLMEHGQTRYLAALFLQALTC